jgi:anti-sigma B factor antagonist
MERVSVDLRVPGVALVSLSGEHELYDALKPRERITALLDGGRSIVVDLTETVFVDSTIVGVLLEAKRLAAERGADYSVVLGETTGKAVRRMFEMTGLVGILPVVERDEAPS